jgi:integrase
LEEIEAVPGGLSDKIRIPELKRGDGVRNIKIDSGRVDEILGHLERYEYASRTHVVWVFHVHTGRRPGALYALDLDDLNLDREDPYLELCHRPGETELKNGAASETEVYVSKEVAQVFEDYVDKNRVDVVTDNDREPFLTTIYGRLSKTTMRRYVYKFSCPCVVTGECPHDRDIDSCEATGSEGTASKCPSSRPPYALRHGYITSKLREGAPTALVSGRCDVGKGVIEKHYDERDEDEKRELRQEVFEEIRDEQNGGGYL